MYGHQAEIQRIQSRLQKIGNANPYRSVDASPDELNRDSDPDATLGTDSKSSPEALDSDASLSSNVSHQDISSRNATAKHPTPNLPPNKSVVDTGSEPHTASETGGSPKVARPERPSEPFYSTGDRYRSVAGKQALREMGEAVNQSKRLPAVDPWHHSINKHSIGKHSTGTPARGHESSAVNAEDLQTTTMAAPYAREDAYVVAHALRHRQAGLGTLQFVEDGPSSMGHGSPYNSHGHSPGLALGPMPRFSLMQGVVWLSGAIVLRMGIDRLLVVFPHLWPLMAAMVLTPVAISLYQTAVNPQATVHSGRRLLVMMMGLLIGGQL